jgi:hypothetical protein
MYYTSSISQCIAHLKTTTIEIDGIKIYKRMKPGEDNIKYSNANNT